MIYNMGRSHAHTIQFSTSGGEPTGAKAPSPIGDVSSISASSLAAYEKDLRLLAVAGIEIPCTEVQIMKYVETWRRKISPRTMYRRLAALRFFYPADPDPPVDGANCSTCGRVKLLQAERFNCSARSASSQVFNFVTA